MPCLSGESLPEGGDTEKPLWLPHRLFDRWGAPHEGPIVTRYVTGNVPSFGSGLTLITDHAQEMGSSGLQKLMRLPDLLLGSCGRQDHQQGAIDET